MTPLKLITRAFRLIVASDADEAPKAAEAEDAFEALNAMLDSWNTEEGMTYTVTIKQFPLVPLQQSYTIGTGGEINTPRPIGIHEATLSLGTSSNPLDYPLQLLSDEEWAAIALKKITTNIPRGIYYDHAYPLGRVYLWPQPGATAYLNLYLWSQIGAFTSLSETLYLPPGWENAIVYNLAVQIAPEYSQEPSPTIMTLAGKYKKSVKMTNRRKRLLECDPILLGPLPLGYGLPGFLAGR